MYDTRGMVNAEKKMQRFGQSLNPLRIIEVVWYIWSLKKCHFKVIYFNSQNRLTHARPSLCIAAPVYFLPISKRLHFKRSNPFSRKKTENARRIRV